MTRSGTPYPRSTLVGQGGSDSPLGCHSLPPQFGRAELPNPFFASRLFEEDMHKETLEKERLF